ncbi:phytoene/squalene synthase family protein [Filimonas effusa]|uniref:Phytoene/squalene synthase family protein n=1 Tax=Filimonas effusa TaxID=2508721 RepID=A0A4Q1D1X4_9BACT|nr:phytoene/squalene synthase family protein [Filimonas effusa]RXK81831.1 phytoene/squalene synthase family protein [Filimonas effusa]
MIQLFHAASGACSRMFTEQYSTSFASAIRLLHKDMRMPIYHIYGFVRLADEIVDSFHDYDKRQLLAQLKADTMNAIRDGISLNPVLHSFQITVNSFKIEHALIDAFFRSMELDLDKKSYDQNAYDEYIYGSAEVVGLMCLSVFCEGKAALYEKLKSYARSLGAAFQKVNFLRDVKADMQQLERFYFPQCDFRNFSQNHKNEIEEDIRKDFDKAFEGIRLLPLKARFGVYVAYKYYLSLFNKIRRVQPHRIWEERIRIPDYGKLFIVAKAGVRMRLNLL